MTNEEQIMEPLSPTGQYLSTPTLSLSVISVLESQIPIDDSQTLSLVNNVFLPINPRFSCIMVTDNDGIKRWKKVEIKSENHVKIPKFPAGMSLEFYDKKFDDYLSELAMKQFQADQPLWEIHIMKYPTSNAAGNVIFKFHHSLGDGYSLMAGLLSSLQRADNPSLPLTFPSVQLHVKKKHYESQIWGKIHRMFSSGIYTISDFYSAFMKSNIVEDDLTPIRSGKIGVESLPVTVTTMSFSIDVIKQIKSKLGVTLNDVISGTIFLGTRLYMQSMKKDSEKLNSTALVLLNTRMTRGYSSLKEMTEPDTESPWGNNFSFLPITIPKLIDPDVSDPLEFVRMARQIIQKKRTSLAVFLTAKYLQLVKRFRGLEVAARYMYGTLKNSSMMITNMIGPLEQMSLANHPIKGLYFVVTGSPQSIMTGIVSYNGELRVAILAEKGFIDPHKYKASVKNAFEMIFKAAMDH